MPTDPARPENAAEALARQRQALAGAARVLASGWPLMDGLRALLGLAAEALAAEAGLIFTWDPAAGLLRPAAALGWSLADVQAVGLQLGEGLPGQVLEAGQARALNDPAEIAAAAAGLRAANRGRLALAGPACALAAPLGPGPERLGVLLLETASGQTTFTPDDLVLAQALADLAAAFIRADRLADGAEPALAARGAERLRAELLATLSHELRMPLTAIKGYASALLLKEVDWSEDKSAEFLRLIEAECDHMQAMLKDLLDSSLASVDQLQMVPEKVQLAALARHAADEVQRSARRHHLVVDFPADFPAVECDPRWTRQVFRNLLDNAVKYSPRGGLIMMRGEARPHDVVVSVSDQGVGIAAEDLIPIFEKFFRVKAALGQHVPGVGLGLPIARFIVEAHGGRIWVESRPGEGTTVYFSLPRSEAAPA